MALNSFWVLNRPFLDMRLELPLQLGSLVFLFLGACGTWNVLRLILPFLRRQLLDHPNRRSVHQTPTPRGGGISFVLVGSLLAPLAGSGWMAWIPLCCCPLALVGMVDDRRDLPATFRYVAQLLTALVLVGVAVPSFPWWLYPLIVIIVTAVINFVNFMDGLDGLVVTIFLVVFGMMLFSTSLLPNSLLTAAKTHTLWPIVGSLVGFLPWNWSPAKVFMGDVGSTYLGALMAGFSLQQETLPDVICYLLVAFPLLGDAATCVCRRFIAGQPIFKAHRLHLFQRLFAAGWSHQHVTLLYALATLILAFAYLYGNRSVLLLLVIIEFFSGVLLDRYVAVQFKA